MEGVETGIDIVTKPVNVAEKSDVNPRDVLLDLVRQDVIKKNPDRDPNRSSFESKHFLVDLPKAVSILSKYKQDKVVIEITFPEEKVKQEAKAAYKRVVKNFVDNGIIPAELAVSVGRLIRPDNVVVVSGDHARFLYLKEEFPQSPEKRADLEIGIEYVNGWGVQEMKLALEKAGVSLNQDTLLWLTLMDGLSHEYGHAVDRVLTLLEAEKHKSATPLEGSKYVWETGHSMQNSVYEKVAPNSELMGMLENQPKDGWYTAPRLTSSERIAVGFENIGLGLALKQLDIEPQTIAKILAEYSKSDRTNIDKYKQLFQELDARGMNFEDFTSGALELYSQLKADGQVDLFAPVSSNYGVRSLGYFFPLNKEQIRAYITQWYKPEIKSN